jgi:uncharacterized OB-fold protein
MNRVPASPWSQPFWHAVDAHRFQLPWCCACERTHFPPRPFCPHCWCDDIEWRPSIGRGRIYSFTTVRNNPPTAFVDRLPYVIGIVRLDDGVQVLANIEPVDASSLAIDAAVEIGFHDDNGRTHLVFRLVAEG